MNLHESTPQQYCKKFLDCIQNICEIIDQENEYIKALDYKNIENIFMTKKKYLQIYENLSEQILKINFDDENLRDTKKLILDKNKILQQKMEKNVKDLEKAQSLNTRLMQIIVDATQKTSINSYSASGELNLKRNSMNSYTISQQL